jgi:hypothetical protein
VLAYNSKLDMFELAKELGALKYTIDGTGALMANGQGRGIPGYGKNAIAEICELRQAPPLHVMVNIIPPGLDILVHVDQIPDFIHVERWHLAVFTNPEAQFFDGRSWSHMEFGCWTGPVKYWEEHAVRNTGKSSRLHFIVDLDKLWIKTLDS